MKWRYKGGLRGGHDAQCVCRGEQPRIRECLRLRELIRAQELWEEPGDRLIVMQKRSREIVIWVQVHIDQFLG